MKNGCYCLIQKILKRALLIVSPLLSFLILPSTIFGQNPALVDWYLTNADKSYLLTKQQLLVASSNINDSISAININDDEVYQIMDGFGFALTGGSAIHINAMDPAERMKLLNELFGNDENSIGISYLRISIGASDLSDKVFTYNDLPAGETDPGQEKFSLEPEKKDLIPVLKEILAINNDITILGSPWSPPVWMKTNGKSKGGSLKPEFFDAYALYFVKYVQGMKAEGIPIDAITIQNESLYPGNNPSMFMPAADQSAFIRKSLGPAFRNAGIKTKIIIYDHNPNRVDYPIEILNDPEARKYIDGTAFHMYEGKVDAISEVHNAYPDKNLYFTEQWVGAPGDFPNDLRWHVRTLIIGAVRNWCKNVIEWNLAADPQQDPHTKGGCNDCLGAITIDGNSVIRNPAYYIIAHASKFVKPGSVRINSNLPEGLPNVAFKTPDGRIVLIVLNDSDKDQIFHIKYLGKSIRTTMKSGSVATFIW
jgi:glucosylceramidase